MAVRNLSAVARFGGDLFFKSLCVLLFYTIFYHCKAPTPTCSPTLANNEHPWLMVYICC